MIEREDCMIEDQVSNESKQLQLCTWYVPNPWKTPNLDLLQIFEYINRLMPHKS